MRLKEKERHITATTKNKRKKIKMQKMATDIKISMWAKA